MLPPLPWAWRIAPADRSEPGSHQACSFVPSAEDITLYSADGTKLHAWWLPGSDRSAGAILHAHGNGGNISHRGHFAAALQKAIGAGVLMFDYPGYGRSEGKPSEEGCYAAGEASFNWLTANAKFP